MIDSPPTNGNLEESRQFRTRASLHPALAESRNQPNRPAKHISNEKRVISNGHTTGSAHIRQLIPVSPLANAGANSVRCLPPPTPRSEPADCQQASESARGGKEEDGTGETEVANTEGLGRHTYIVTGTLMVCGLLSRACYLPFPRGRERGKDLQLCG